MSATCFFACSSADCCSAVKSVRSSESLSYLLNTSPMSIRPTLCGTSGLGAFWAETDPTNHEIPARQARPTAVRMILLTADALLCLARRRLNMFPSGCDRPVATSFRGAGRNSCGDVRKRKGGLKLPYIAHRRNLVKTEC